MTRIATVLLLAVLTACGGSPPMRSSADVAPLLTQAGFKTVGATTPDQQAHLQSMPKDQVTVYTDTGRNWYIYPDTANGRIYVGKAEQYQTYLQLRTQNGMGPPPSFEQTYQKQDAQMRVNTQKDVQNPWGFWPSFDNLGWQ